WAEGELIQKAFDFGENAIVSYANYNGYTFEENVKNSCDEWDVNKIYGILTPPSEKGVVNQPKDMELMKPFAQGPGMVQGAQRFSEISKRCPQLSGVIIDDFYNDYPKSITAEDLLDIKDALLGKRVDENGSVDHSSPAATPRLKLYVVVYNHQLDRVDKNVLDLIDGVSFWTWKQNENYEKFDENIETLRRAYPNKEILAGVYIFNSKQTPTPDSVHYLIEHAIRQYAKGNINSLLLFSAIWLSREKISPERWRELDLPNLLNRIYYPFLGEATGRVVDAKTKKPIKNALVTVTRSVGGKSLLVARKFADERGEYRFGGWAGDKNSVYQIKIGKSFYKNRQRRVRLQPGESLKLSDVRLSIE
ncbi:MAG: carboxypeptidase regulatory-like domain-containing protein, partial [Pyrinomonadaceae bacterium]